MTTVSLFYSCVICFCNSCSSVLLFYCFIVIVIFIAIAIAIGIGIAIATFTATAIATTTFTTVTTAIVEVAKYKETAILKAAQLIKNAQDSVALAGFVRSLNPVWSAFARAKTAKLSKQRGMVSVSVSDSIN